MKAPLDEPATLDEEICSDVIRVGLAGFDGQLGKYLSGEIPLYRGQASGQDNAEAIGLPSGRMSGAAIATLVSFDAESVWTLDVFVPAQSLHMSVRQHDERPDVLSLSHVLDRWSSGGLDNVAAADGLQLALAPSSIELALSVSGEWLLA